MKWQPGRVIENVPPMRPVNFDRKDAASSLVNALDECQADLDAIRDGFISKTKAKCPKDPDERARHIKSFAHFQDAIIQCQSRAAQKHGVVEIDH